MTRWETICVDHTDQRRFRSFATYKEAVAALHQAKAEVDAVRAGVKAAPPQPHTFGELCGYWRDHRAAHKRSGKDDRSVTERHLRPAFGELQVSQVKVARVDAFRDTKGELHPKTLHNILTLLISMLRLAVELGWLASVPPIKKPRLVEQEYQWLKTTDQIRRLLVAAEAEGDGVAELYATAVYTGMRAGEILSLRWEDVSFVRRLITVKASYDRPTKTGAIRHVPILDPLLPVLRAWRLRSGDPWVFPNRTGTMQQPSARVLQETFKACLDHAELRRVRFHDLRHTFASHWVMSGGDLYKLQRILGHKSFAMTQRYAHLAPEVFAEDHGRLADAVPKSASVIALTDRKELG